jgi:hypothetical protein
MCVMSRIEHKIMRSVASMSRSRLASITFTLAVCCSMPTYAQQAETTEAFKQAIFKQAITQAQTVTTQYYLHGEPELALQQFQALAENADWKSLLWLANVTWRVQPEQSFQWHLKAYENGGHDNSALLELAYDYTRQDDCPKAIEAWQKLDSEKMLGIYQPMLAGYCYLQLGQDKEAYQMFDRAILLQQRFEDALIDLWERQAMAEHAHRLKALKTESNLANLKAVLDNVVNLAPGKLRGTALLALTDTIKTATNLGDAPSQLNCLRPAFEQEATDAASTMIKAVWQRHLGDCKLLVGENPLPENSALAELLVVYALNKQIASAEELLASHGATLDKRARSQAGDHEALRILAALQEKTRHPGLKESDELGWSRYADPEFATSLINKMLQRDKTLSAEGLALLEKAHLEFPHDQRILTLWLNHSNPPAEAARQGWREVALLEFHKPTLDRDLHFWLRAMNLYRALNKYYEASGLTGIDWRLIDRPGKLAP